MQNISKYTSWVLYILMALTLGCFIAFYAGGGVEDAQGYFVPNNTDIVLNLAFVTLGIGTVLSVVFALFQFGVQLKDSPKEALKTLAILGAFVALLVISWSMGDGTPLNLPGYDGAHNVESWLKVSDMWLYTAEFLLGASILAICVFSVAKVLRK